MKPAHWIVPLLIVLAAACGSSGDSVTDPEVNLPQGSLSARIDGTTWRASTALGATYSGNVLAFAGTNNASTLALAVGIIHGPGTYSIGQIGAPSNGLFMEGTRSWHAVSGVGTGTVTITAISATRATGTFSFTAQAVANSGASGSKAVTEGRFDLKY